MLAIEVRLLHQTIRAASPDNLGLTGSASDRGDWPPSPSRLFAALVAADGTRDRRTVTTGEELRLLEEAAPPVIVADSRDDVAESSPLGRFVVAPEIADNTVHEYPGRIATLVRPSRRLAPQVPRVIYVWPDLSPSPDEMKALRFRAARVGYLGCSDSPVHIHVRAEANSDLLTQGCWELDREGDADLGVPFPGLIEVLDAVYDTSAVRPTRREEFPIELRTYRDPHHIRSRRPTTIWREPVWLTFDRSLSSRSALAVTGTLKRAVLDLYQRHIAGPGVPLPAELHGHHDPTARNYQHVQWLALPHVGQRHADGRVHGAAIMFDRSVDPAVVRGLQRAVWYLRELVVPALGAVRTQVRWMQGLPWATSPRRWSGPARRWTSVYPVVHERRLKRDPSLDDIAAWCAHAGYPPPIAMWNSPVPILAGSPGLRPADVYRDRQDSRRPYSYVTVEFAEAVRGPIVLGRARQFGMGLMAPHRGTDGG